jgi:hypothetical protein
MIKLGVATGKADYGIQVYSGYLEYNHHFSHNLSISAKTTFMFQSGPEARSGGLGDIYITTSFNHSPGFTFTGGFKIPLSDGNHMQDGIPLPMDYQSSLGTLDLILGAGYRIKGFQASIGYQQPLTQNKNTFVSFVSDIGEPLYNRQPTKGFIRKADILCRLTYEFKAGEKVKIIPGILPIYHVGVDEFTDTDGIVKPIEGSQGLTLNGTLYLQYEISRKGIIEVNFGMPFITRETRPDGLTRKYMVGVEYSILF